MRKLSTPVGRMPKWPPLTIVMSRMATLRHSLSAIALFPLSGADSALPPATRPLPSILPGPSMVTFSRLSPQIRLLCQWLCPKSWNGFPAPGSAGSYPFPLAGAAARIVAFWAR